MRSTPTSVIPDMVLNASHPQASPSPSLDRAEQVMIDYIQPAICVFGILCNLLNLLVLTRPKLKESPYTYLLGLAISDLNVLLMVFIRTVISRRIGHGVYGWQFFNAYIFLPIGNIFSNSSVWITVFLTVERWISVKFPLKAKKICTKKLARKAMVLIAITMTCINIPRFFCRQIILKTVDNVTEYTMISSKFEKSSFYEVITWMYIVCIHAIPCLTLTVLNACLLSVVYKANKDRAELNVVNKNNIAVHISREQRRLTVTCASIIVLFLICVVPTAFANPPVAYALFGKGKTQDDFFQGSFYRLFVIVSNTLLTCNLSLNFVLYCLFNQKFYKTLAHLVRSYLYRLFKIEIPDTTFKRMSNSTSSSEQGGKLMVGLSVGDKLCSCKRCRPRGIGSSSHAYHSSYSQTCTSATIISNGSASSLLVNSTALKDSVYQKTSRSSLCGRYDDFV